MAAVRKCDRCGALIEHKIYPIKFNVFKQSLLGSILKFESFMTYSEYDLCPNCTTKLKDFLKGEELSKHAAENEQLHSGGLY